MIPLSADVESAKQNFFVLLDYGFYKKNYASSGQKRYHK